jgi:hypothetical protein
MNMTGLEEITEIQAQVGTPGELGTSEPVMSQAYAQNAFNLAVQGPAPEVAQAPGMDKVDPSGPGGPGGLGM